MAAEVTLFSLCKKRIEDSLVEMSKNFLADKSALFNEYSKDIEGFSRQLCEMPSPCHDGLAHHCLKAANRLTDDLTSESTELVSRNQFLIQQLVSSVTHLKMKKLDLSEWSKPVREVLLNFLWRMTHLEKLICHSGDGSIELEPRLSESLPFLKNITFFDSTDCTNETIAALCENCEHLAYVSVCSPQVTDKSIDSLILCRKLVKVRTETGITEAGLVKLLVKSKSENLTKLNLVPRKSFSCNFLALLETEAAPSDTFQLRKFRGYNIDGKHLPLICKYFSHLQSLSLTCSSLELPDFSCLDCLGNLKSFVLHIDTSERIEQIYLLKSQNLTALFFSNCLQISMIGLFNIGCQCPNVTLLAFTNCTLYKDVDYLTASTIGKPFQKLELFAFHSNLSASGVEVLLMHAANIKIVYLVASSGLTDAFIAKIFKFNKLKELNTLLILSENSISATMLKSIIQRCKNINFLRKFAPSDDSDAVAKAEFESLQKFITKNKYDVQLK